MAEATSPLGKHKDSVRDSVAEATPPSGNTRDSVVTPEKCTMFTRTNEKTSQKKGSEAKIMGQGRDETQLDILKVHIPATPWPAYISI